ncbi:kinase-like domain-containing protein, partial [Blyttiomyces helicus]
EIFNLFSQICLGLHHIHSHNIIHRDLKTNNIFISGTGPSKVLKIGDFGISKVMSSKSNAETVVGTPSYLSPELCEGKPYNVKSDIWALGCILYELVCLHRLFEGSNLPALVMKIMRGTYEPIPSPPFSSHLQTLIASCVRLNPDARPAMSSIMALPVMQEHLIEAQLGMGRVAPVDYVGFVAAGNSLVGLDRLATRRSRA